MATACRALVVVDGPIGRVDVEAMFRRVHCTLLGRPDRTVLCDVGRVSVPDAPTVGALARLAFVARRLGGSVELRNASPDLQALLWLMGLTEVVRPSQQEARAGYGGRARGVLP